MIYLEEMERVKHRIRERDINICVVGSGTIGLPLATFLAKEGFRVYCYDVDEQRVNDINDCQVVFEYHDLLKEVSEKGRISASTNPEETIANAEIIFVCVPTPLDKERGMSDKYLLQAAEDIGNQMKKGAVVIFESSVAIGTTESIKKKVEEVSEKLAGKDFGVAYCPERYNPGLPMEKHPEVIYEDNSYPHDQHKFNEISRVIGAIDKKSLTIAEAMYSTFIKGRLEIVSSIEAAEATKLLENIFRDVNIALANELAKVYSKFGLDAFEIINAAKSKPFAFLPHYPGPGVGGECIPVDTHYLIKQAEEKGLDVRLMRSAREVNDSMPEHVIGLLEKSLKDRGKEIKGSKICILGISYKKNINDTRLSPSLALADLLKGKGANVSMCDPLISRKKFPDLISIVNAFKDKDAVILSTDHDIFKSINLEKERDKMREKIIIDGRNFFLGKKLKELGFTYRCVGKGE